MPFQAQAYFKYTQLQSREHIRLIKLHRGKQGSPVHVDLYEAILHESSDTYSALSYTWGDGVESRHIRVNGMPFRLASDLRIALEDLRQPEEDLILWADAICINQKDAAEKSMQVGRMSEIFGSASRVLAWLGPSTDKSDSCFEIMSRDCSQHG